MMNHIDQYNLYYPTYNRLDESENTYFKFQMYPNQLKNAFIPYGRLMRLEDITILRNYPYEMKIPANCGSIWIAVNSDEATEKTEQLQLQTDETELQFDGELFDAPNSHQFIIYHAQQHEQRVRIVQNTDWIKRYVQLTYWKSDSHVNPQIELFSLLNQSPNTEFFRDGDFATGVLTLDSGMHFDLPLSHEIEPIWIYQLTGKSKVKNQVLLKGDSFACRANNVLRIKGLADNSKVIWAHAPFQYK